MTLIGSYGRNGKIFSVWRISPTKWTFQFRKGDRVVGRLEVYPWQNTPLDFKARRILKGHQPLIDAIERLATAYKKDQSKLS